ncbi:AP-5 complex subunit beta-1-like isoform X1 [Alosa alosa]|uniref:AP-5 complex subunit beta-1-like isoform X1 n=1 Tax=Alosa sapidissima TaxID=34773 RepID=UPI001C0A56B3|nr:AP-5 complex subunit beta-1-like isoform X1 [Alosa sapidissima]XP_041946407.1 AP-5 complex subunit beta-1-like isoform X1 [Alosa sapidissima]XP_041946408.1 AP-5 complex subunit beta-1-like isoform X1 [Alosa sapidissima]XP_041946409.1 AP-5 complex subunit beta-1-like isoform X1 [Alosa sapidissima]XP_048110638.1 AP-5 complex subunit beta-1-like isoform X1 [Alosa alosa]XP_048110639.1 AP-5 complex subunit beta-1-like isoform X1 [Alosa alosa]XP_048110640.1 AP-5 complex subunit beta-1-like isofo
MASLTWSQRISAFSLSPSQFLSSITSDSFLAELLRELRDDKASDNTKVLLLSPFLEHPTILCPTVSVGEETALELMSVLAQTPPKAVSLKCNLMVAISTVLICTTCMERQPKVAEDYLDQLFHTIEDTNDHRGGLSLQPIRATSCECLREMEMSYPGLLSQRLETLYQLKQLETTVVHQAYSALYTLTLKNAVFLLCQKEEVANADLKTVLCANEGFGWKAIHKPLPPAIFSQMEEIPQLRTGVDCKELKSIVSSLLEESYLLTPMSQAALLRELVDIVSMVPSLSPALFKSQLLRLFGTAQVELVHATLMMKSAFTDSLFSPDDENFFLKRLVCMAQHPLLNIPEKLFYIDCIRHFPENRPISSQGDESLPVLVTPRLTISLLPTVFNDSSTMLCRLKLMCMVYLEADEGEDSKGVAYLFDHLMALLKIVDNHGRREMVVTAFRAVFIFLTYFSQMENLPEVLIQKLSELYSRQCRLAPNLINLCDRIQGCMEDSVWSVKLLKSLQRLVVDMPPSQLTLQNFSWHLKILKRAAVEKQIPQGSSLYFLLKVLYHSSLCERGGWKVGNAILAVCRNLLLHPCVNQASVSAELADLLHHMAGHYDDTDIRDHARFYYTLLTNLSLEKLSGVLVQSQEGGQAKVRSLSAIMAETEGLSSHLTIHPTSGPVLQFVRLQHVSFPPVTYSTEDTTAVENVLDHYRSQFSDADFASEVTLKYKLAYLGETEPLFEKLFSICLSFDLKDSNYEDMCDIHVPCLFRDRKPPEVSLKLKPKQPYPTCFKASAVFSTEDGLTWQTQLPDVKVCFPDIFLPMPVPVGSSSSYKENVFDRLWEDICATEADRSAISLFCFEGKDNSLQVMNKQIFQNFLISDPSDIGECKVLFFLPPRFHILFRINLTEDAVKIDIGTDNWELLPHINSYLLKITEK